MTTATAHPNIALIKYWGKQDRPGNYPATPNVSITLSGLVTQTTVQEADRDQVTLNGQQVEEDKILHFLRLLRGSFQLSPLHIDTHNNFPTGAGLASSASGFAALITAINAHGGLGLDQQMRSAWARQGSASAARSVFSGFVTLAPPDWQATTLATAEHWPLNTIVAVTNERAKSVNSTTGMARSRSTSPFYDPWVKSCQEDYTLAVDAIARQDFELLGETAERNCLKMHSVMLTSLPALAYWNPATVGCMQVVRELRAAGTGVFFTIDAGPQVKAICQANDVERVNAALQSVPGVQRTLICGMGNGAHISSL